MENLQNKEFYEFGAFRLNVKERLLSREDEPVALTLKEFEVLLFLVENAGEVIGKDDLLDAVWKDVFIEEGTLTRNISRLRKKLETENGRAENIIETMPKRGYRFLPEVTKSNKNALVIEEKTLTHIRVEEIITVDNAELMRRGEGEKGRKGERENKIVALPNISPSPVHPITLSPFLPFALGLVALAGIGFIIYQNYFQNSVPKAVVATRIMPFTGATGREDTPAFSPDGKQLAYSWNGSEGNENDIYVRLIGTGEPLRLTNTKANEQYPTFSPDGSHIAFVRGKFGKPGEVMLIPSLGGAERRIRRLFSGNYSISYSPDGQNIAVIDTENSTDGGQYSVYLVNLQTEERRRLTAPAEFIGETTPRFSPDGKSLAFVRIAGTNKQDLFVVPADGGEPRQITFDNAIINSLAWSADGQMIYFVSFRVGNQPIIWRIPATGGTAEIVSTNGKSITNIAVSSNGKTLVFVENSNSLSIWSVTANGQPANKLFVSTGSENNPRFSPDDSRIGFVSTRTGKAEIWTADTSGKNLRQITNSPTDNISPQFSPDGSHIVFMARKDETSNIIIIAADGGAERRITSDNVYDGSPGWSADGTQIYFTSNRSGTFQLWRVPANGGEPVQITQNGAVQVRIAPDGKTIYYIKSDETTELWRIPAEGGTEEMVPEFTAAGFAGKWTMTRSGIYFYVRNSNQSLKIMFYDFANRQITDTTRNYNIPLNIFENPAAAADGSIFLYSIQDQLTSRLMLVELPQKAN